MFAHMLDGFYAAFSLANLAALVFGSFVGVVVGILPGLGPMVGMVVLLPFTFSFPPDIALSLLLGVFCGGYFGGAIPAVLLRTPGVPSSIVTSFDGYPLTQQGQAQTALSAALLGSFGGGVISVLILMFLAPVLAHVAASFGPPEYFTVALFGVVLASFMSYDTAKRLSPEKERFGHGTPEGCIASEAGNNAVPAGAMIPLLTLGIPGDALSAVLLGVFTINGIYPGPLLLVKEPVLISTLYFSMLLINVAAFAMLMIWLRPFAMIVKVPGRLLAVIIMVVSMVGIYAVNTRLFDAGVAVVMGVLGYALLRMGWPVVTLVMGVVLGEIMENRLRQTLSLGDGSLMILFQRPICLVLLALTLLTIAVPLIRDARKKEYLQGENK